MLKYVYSSDTLSGSKLLSDIDVSGKSMESVEDYDYSRHPPTSKNAKNIEKIFMAVRKRNNRVKKNHMFCHIILTPPISPLRLQHISRTGTSLSG
ncbi:hypothetical protein TNCV_1547281 [Trichonephila clavipes]|nr:hypothetical protein TNCV_1547281 [Trichonephila clavipes]